MNIMLNNAKLTILRNIILSRAPAEVSLVEHIASGKIQKEEIKKILEYLAAELCENGFDDDSEPTTFGLELEYLIDELNRPNLK